MVRSPGGLVKPSLARKTPLPTSFHGDTESLTMSSLAVSHLKSRGWLVAGGIFSLLAGLAAIAVPYLFSVVLVQLLGALCLVTGVIAFSVSVFERHAAHRVLNALLALIRIVAGLALLLFIPQGIMTITLLLGAFFVTEGVFCAATALQMRDRKGWMVLLLNGLVALVLGLMVFSKWPNDSGWIIGLLYGINSVFGGLSLLALGLNHTKHPSREG